MTWPSFGHTLSVIIRVLAVTLIFVPLFVLGLSIDSSAVLVFTQVVYTVAVVAVLFHQVVTLVDERLENSLGSEQHSPDLSGRFVDPDEDALTHDTPLDVVETAVDLHGDDRVPPRAFDLLLHSSSSLSVDDLAGGVLANLDAVDAADLDITIIDKNLDRDVLESDHEAGAESDPEGAPESDLEAGPENGLESGLESDVGVVFDNGTLENDTLEGIPHENAVIAVSDPEIDAAPVGFLVAPEDGDWRIIALG